VLRATPAHAWLIFDADMMRSILGGASRLPPLPLRTLPCKVVKCGIHARYCSMKRKLTILYEDLPSCCKWVRHISQARMSGMIKLDVVGVSLPGEGLWHLLDPAVSLPLTRLSVHSFVLQDGRISDAAFITHSGKIQYNAHAKELHLGGCAAACFIQQILCFPVSHGLSALARLSLFAPHAAIGGKAHKERIGHFAKDCVAFKLPYMDGLQTLAMTGNGLGYGAQALPKGLSCCMLGSVEGHRPKTHGAGLRTLHLALSKEESRTYVGQTLTQNGALLEVKLVFDPASVSRYGVQATDWQCLSKLPDGLTRLALQVEPSSLQVDHSCMLQAVPWRRLHNLRFLCIHGAGVDLVSFRILCRQLMACKQLTRLHVANGNIGCTPQESDADYDPSKRVSKRKRRLIKRTIRSGLAASQQLLHLDLRSNCFSYIDAKTMVELMPSSLQHLCLANAYDVPKTASEPLDFSALIKLSHLDLHGIGAYSGVGVEVLTSLRTLAINVCVFHGQKQVQGCALPVVELPKLKQLKLLHLHAVAHSPASTQSIVESMQVTTEAIAELTSLHRLRLTCTAWTVDDEAAMRAAMGEGLVGQISGLVKLEQIACGPYGPSQALRQQLGECAPRWRPLLRALTHTGPASDNVSVPEQPRPDNAALEPTMQVPQAQHMLTASDGPRTPSDAASPAQVPANGICAVTAPSQPCTFRGCWRDMYEASHACLTMCLLPSWCCGAMLPGNLLSRSWLSLRCRPYVELAT
jgi:hypothetical protein